MALGDIRVLRTPGFTPASKTYNVAAGTTIYAGEPVARALGGVAVTAATDGTPVVGTDYYAGIATTTSTATASVAGIVEVMPIVPGLIFGIKPKTAATWDTQAEYNALVGKRITIDLTSGTYTCDATDGATNGCVVAPLDIKDFPGTVAFEFRAAVSDQS